MLKDINWDTLDSLLQSSSKEELFDYLDKHELIIKDNKIFPKNENELPALIEYLDGQQHNRKISLNASYGSLLQANCRFFDKRLGQSTTLSGRQVVKHMTSKVNEVVTSEYDFLGNSIVYGDSVTSDSLINISDGTCITIEGLFNLFNYKVEQDEKEYSIPRGELDNSGNIIKVLGYNSYEDTAIYGEISYVMRHRTCKQKWKISSSDSNVTVTNDHSIIIDRDGFILEVKPSDLLPNDLLIINSKSNDTIRLPINNIECLGDFDNEYVYDISMSKQDPFFFANNILVHNTDSCYFTAYTTLKDDIDKGVIPWTKDTVVQLYDQIGDMVNESFPAFMEKAFHCPTNRGDVIKCGREIVATDALFITKKRYAAMVYDKEGKRKDKDGKPGEIKAMGLDLKRSDTPEYMQKFLMKVLEKVLTNSDESVILDMIKEFRDVFKGKPGWEKGTPKRVNNIGKFFKVAEEKGKTTMPGHVRASINWNILRKINNDNFSMQITDGAKVIVCKLKNNPMGFTSIAYPIDELRLPEWFKELPFDHHAMEDVIIDAKIDNLIGILKYDINSTKLSNSFNSLFDFH